MTARPATFYVCVKTRYYAPITAAAGVTPKSARVSRDGSSHSSIWLWAVPSAQRKEVEAVLLAEALPRLLEWLRKAEREGNVRRAKSRHIDFRHLDGALRVEEF